MNPYDIGTTLKIQQAVYGGPAINVDPMMFVYPAYMFILVAPFGLLPLNWAVALFAGTLTWGLINLILILSFQWSKKFSRRVILGIVTRNGKPALFCYFNFKGTDRLFRNRRLVYRVALVGSETILVRSRARIGNPKAYRYNHPGNWLFALVATQKEIYSIIWFSFYNHNSRYRKFTRYRQLDSSYLSVLKTGGGAPVIWSLQALFFPWNIIYIMFFAVLLIYTVKISIYKSDYNLWMSAFILAGIAFFPMRWIYDLFLGILIPSQEKNLSTLSMLSVSLALISPWSLIFLPEFFEMEFCCNSNSTGMGVELNDNHPRSQPYFSTMNKLKFSAIGKTQALLEFLVPILVFIILTRTPQDADMWWHLSAGQVMWQSKTILLTDTFSYTRFGHPWVNAFWISEIVFYLAYKLGGYFSLTLLVALIGAATFYFLYRRMEGNKFVNAFIIILATLTAAPIWSPRPQIFSFFILALLDGWLNQLQKNNNQRSLWILILVFAVWANIHGGWIWGFLLLAAYVVGIALNNLSKENRVVSANWKFLSHLIFWSLVAGLAIGLNPNGISIWRLPFTTANVSMQIQEWASPDFHQMEFQPLLWMLFLLIATAVLAKPKTNWTSLLKIIGFAYLTFVSQRNIALLAIIAAPTLGRMGQQRDRKYKNRFRNSA